MRVLIAGCGYVGKATAELFRGAGWEVEGWTSRDVDIGDDAAVVRAAKGAFDAVLQLASTRGGDAEAYRRIYLEGARNLTNAFPDARLLFASSTSVYAQTGGEWVTEESRAEPKRETGRILREAEDLALAHGAVVARLGGIYGPGRSALLRKFLAGEAVIDSTEERFINQVHRDDIAAALFLLVQAQTSSAIYNVTDNHPITIREAYELLATTLERPFTAERLGSPERKRGNSNKRVCSEKLLKLGWSPRYPTFQIGLTQSVLPNFERLGA